VVNFVTQRDQWAVGSLSLFFVGTRDLASPVLVDRDNSVSVRLFIRIVRPHGCDDLFPRRLAKASQYG